MLDVLAQQSADVLADFVTKKEKAQKVKGLLLTVFRTTFLAHNFWVFLGTLQWF
jgi:hypothetical protein